MGTDVGEARAVMTERDWRRVEWMMRRIADATAGTTFGCILGCRSSDRGTAWYSHVRGIEIDGSTPLQAVEGVFNALVREAKEELDTANRKAAERAAAMRALSDLTGMPD